jgi:predicted small lipoprotein YifL
MIRALAVLALLSLLTACGQKGPLKLPPGQAPAAPATPAPPPPTSTTPTSP